MRRWSFTKGHGTGNDFVLLVDRAAMIDLSEPTSGSSATGRPGSAPTACCGPSWPSTSPAGPATAAVVHGLSQRRRLDRRDVRQRRPGVRPVPDRGVARERAGGQVATRAGVKEAPCCPTDRSACRWVRCRSAGSGTTVTTADGTEFSALPCGRGQPARRELRRRPDRMPLYLPPTWRPVDSFPDGVNLEFVRAGGERHRHAGVRARVGETRSCGTGTVAVAAASRIHRGRHHPAAGDFRVDVPGGTVQVESTNDQAYLTGPAVLVARGEVADPRLMIILDGGRTAVLKCRQRRDNKLTPRETLELYDGHFYDRAARQASRR